jgi:hypothetical protein
VEVGAEAAARELGLLWGGVAAVVAAVLPFAGRFAPFAPACPFKALTGWPCLSCGATRAVVALSRLDFQAAVWSNPLAAAATILLVGGGLLAGGAALSGRALPRLGPPPAWLRSAAIGAVLANWAWLAATGK